MKALAASGGGIRGIAHVGCLDACLDFDILPSVTHESHGVYREKLDISQFDAFCGDSSASLIMAMVVNGWSIELMRGVILDTEFKKFFTFMPWGFRLTMAPFKPIELKKFAKWIDSLGFKPENADKLFVNAWDADNNQHVIFCNKKPDWAVNDTVLDEIWVEDAFHNESYGTVLTRSMTLPGLRADHPKWKDGGIASHPPVHFLPEHTDLTLFNLGYAGLVPGKPKRDFISDANECFQVAAHSSQGRMLSKFTGMTEINPRIYDVSSTSFNLSRKEKEDLIDRAYNNVVDDFDVLLSAGVGG